VQVPNWDFLDRDIALGSEWRHCTSPNVYVITGFSLFLDDDKGLELVHYQLKNEPESKTYSRSREQFLGLKMLIDGKAVYRFDRE
jgi:hypothetical protein